MEGEQEREQYGVYGSSKINRGDDLDIVEGIRQNRRCTDILFLILFIGHIGVFTWTGVTGIQNGGNPLKLTAGRDYSGSMCGYDDSTNDFETPMTGYDKTLYTVNVTYVANALMHDTFSAGSVTSTVNTAAAALDTSLWIQSADTVNEYISDAFFDNFHPVCVTSCPIDFTGLTARTYSWEGPLLTADRVNWDTYKTANSGSYDTYFAFDALPVDICPYDAKYCVIIPDWPVADVLDKYCVPKVVTTSGSGSSTVVDSSTLPDSFSQGFSSNFGTMVGDLITAWPLLAIICGAALVIGLIFMFIMRWCAGTFIWFLIFSIFGVMGACGATAFLYSMRCVNESLSTTATRIGDNGLDMYDECVDGYSVTNENQRNSVRIFSYVVMGLSLVYLLFMIVLCKRIRIGVAVQKVAAQFVSQNKMIILVPILQIIAVCAWMAGWLYIAASTVSQIPTDNTFSPSETYSSWDDASDVCGSNAYMSGFTSASVTTTTLVIEYKCMQSRYHFDWRICFQFFSLLWVSDFLVAWGQLIVSGAVGVWYFSPNTEKGSLGLIPIRKGMYNAFRYHLGTAAFGSFLLATLSWFKWALVYLSQLNKTTNSKIIKRLLWPIFYLLSCVERFIAFLNKNAFIQTALAGTNFCTSSKNSFTLVARNLGRFGILSGISFLVNTFGRMFITALTAGTGWVLIYLWYDGMIQNPIFVVLAFIIIGFFVSGMVMNVLALSVAAVMQCFLIDEEVNSDDGGAKFTPGQLATFIQEHEASQQ